MLHIHSFEAMLIADATTSLWKEPFTEIVTPCIGSLDAWSTILPVIVFCWDDNESEKNRGSNASSTPITNLGFIMTSFGYEKS